MAALHPKADLFKYHSNRQLCADFVDLVGHEAAWM
jgi:hypothetical protein